MEAAKRNSKIEVIDLLISSSDNENITKTEVIEILDSDLDEIRTATTKIYKGESNFETDKTENCTANVHSSAILSNQTVIKSVNSANASENSKSYYQRAFNSIISTVTEVYHPILSSQELEILIKIISRDGLTNSAQKLFIRLVLRKIGWHRQDKLVYDDILNVPEAARELSEKSICTLGSDNLLDYLELLTLAELKYLAVTKLFLKIGSRRDEIIKSILTAKSSGQQRISFLPQHKHKFPSRTTNTTIIHQFTGSIIKICDQVRQLIETALSLYFLVSETDQTSRQENLSTAILVEINRRSYPKYEIIRRDPIFRTRTEYLEYQEALELEIELKEQQEEKDGLVDEKNIFELVEATKRKVILFIHNCDPNRSYFLRRYTAGWVYCRILGQLGSTLETIKRYNVAVEIYQFLLNQKLFCLGHRGRWWERSVLDTSKHLKDPQRAIEFCEEALKDSWLRTSALTSIRRRIKKLDANSQNQSLLSFEEEEPEVLILAGRIQTGNIPGKKVKLHLDGDDLSLGSVEEFVLNEFSLDGWEGVHSESSYFTSIFGLIFWDLLFETNVPDVFQTAYQTGPLDLNTDAFYPQRCEALEARLKLIEEQFEDSIKLLKRNHLTHHKVSCVGVNWTDYSGEEGIDILVKIARGIGGMALSLILRQFCEDYRHNRSGMPDLILWRTSSDPSKLIQNASNGVLFAEVKSPNDRVSDAQRHWFSVLKEGGMRVIVVRVHQSQSDL